MASLAAWRSTGWTIPSKVHEDFDLVDARASGHGPKDSAARLHLTYSDGLSSVSVFACTGTGSIAAWAGTARCAMAPNAS